MDLLRKLWRWSILVCIIVIGGCGFELRGTLHLPTEFTPLSIDAKANSLVADALRKAIHNENYPYTEDSTQAALILRIVEETIEKRTLSVDEQGKVVSILLIYRVTFEGVNKNAELSIIRQKVEISREYANPQIETLGKLEEGEWIQNALAQEIANYIIRQLNVQLTKSSSSRDLATPAAQH